LLPRLPVGRTSPVIDEPAADFSFKPTLTGEKVVLRPFIEDISLPSAVR
jgi:hypothetical protein